MGQSGAEFIIHLFEVSHLFNGTDGLIDLTYCALVHIYMKDSTVIFL